MSSHGQAGWRFRPCQNPGRKEEGMKEKDQIVENWLPRYTGVPLDIMHPT